MAAAQPRHRTAYWGWHPLRPEWADRLVEASPVRSGDVVVDLGAGDGALTRPLARTGCRVLAVELHPARAAALRDRFADSEVAVLELDAAAFRWPGHPFRVVANPPYAGVNALVRRLIAIRHLRSADLVVAVPSGPVTASALVDGWNRAALVTAAVSLLGALVVLLVGERTAVPVVDEAERPEIESPRAVDAA